MNSTGLIAEMNSLRPFKYCIEKYSLSKRDNSLNLIFYNTILMMSINSAKWLSLSSTNVALFKGLGVKYAIIIIVMIY